MSGPTPVSQSRGQGGNRGRRLMQSRRYSLSARFVRGLEKGRKGYYRLNERTAPTNPIASGSVERRHPSSADCFLPDVYHLIDYLLLGYLEPDTPLARRPPGRLPARASAGAAPTDLDLRAQTARGAT